MPRQKSRISAYCSPDSRMLAGTESNAQPMRGEPEVNTWRSIVLPSQANRQVNCITIESCSEMGSRRPRKIAGDSSVFRMLTSSSVTFIAEIGDEYECCLQSHRLRA